MAKSGKTPAGEARKTADALGVWIAIGAGAGLTFGLIFGQIALGIALGAGAGIVIGVVMCRHPDGGHREGEEAT